MKAVHYRRPGGGYPCGAGRRWPSQTITSTGNRDAVTCRSCVRVLTANAHPTSR